MIRDVLCQCLIQRADNCKDGLACLMSFSHDAAYEQFINTNYFILKCEEIKYFKSVYQFLSLNAEAPLLKNHLD